LSVVGPCIARVEVTGPLEMVLDDLRFTPGGIVPAVTRSWARLKRYYR
jgi:hypothetical protein